MGERLNLEIKEKGKVLACAYYHWSGYTSSALELTNLVLYHIGDENYRASQLEAIKLLEATGSGLTDAAFEYGKRKFFDFDKYHFRGARNRDDGLTDISPKGIKETEKWEEHRVEINLDTKIVDFSKAIWKMDKAEYLLDKNNIKEYKELPIVNVELNDIPFSEFEKFFKQIVEIINNNIYRIKMEDGSVCFFTE